MPGPIRTLGDLDLSRLRSTDGRRAGEDRRLGEGPLAGEGRRAGDGRRRGDRDTGRRAGLLALQAINQYNDTIQQAA